MSSARKRKSTTTTTDIEDADADDYMSDPDDWQGSAAGGGGGDIEPVDDGEPIVINGLAITDRKLRAFARLFRDEQLLFHAACAADPPLPERATVRVSNNVVQVRLSSSINWTFLVSNGVQYGMRYAAKKFRAVDLLIHAPRLTVRIHPRTICCNGAADVRDSIYGVQFALDAMHAMRDEYGLCIYESLHCVDVRLVNMMAGVNFGFMIDTERLSQQPFAECESKDFSSVKMRARDLDPQYFDGRKTNMQVSDSGTMTVSGARSRAEIARVYELMLPILQAHSSIVMRASSSDTPANIKAKTRDRQLQARTTLALVNALPADSLSVVRIVHIPREERTRPQQSNALVLHHAGTGALVTTRHGGSSELVSAALAEDSMRIARNVVAMRSFEAREAAARRELDDELDREIAASEAAHKFGQNPAVANAIRSGIRSINVLSRVEGFSSALLHD